MNVWSEWVLEVGSTDTDLVVAAPGSAGAEPCPCHRDQTTETQTLGARGLFLVSTISAITCILRCSRVSRVGSCVTYLWHSLGHVTGLIIWAPVTSVTSLATGHVQSGHRDAELRARLSNYQFSIYPMQPTQTKTRIISTFPQPRDAQHKAQSTRSVLFLLMKDNDCHFPWWNNIASPNKYITLIAHNLFFDLPPEWIVIVTVAMCLL